MIGARGLAGAGDTRTPMYVRLTSLPTNVALNALLIFGLAPFPALGVAGAAIGTAIANTLSAAIFLVVLGSGRFAVGLPIRGRQWDSTVASEIVRVGLPVGGVTIGPGLGLGLVAVYLSLLGDYYARAAVNWYRFSSGRWKDVAHRAGIGVE